jgi:hypothetical protein
LSEGAQEEEPQRDQVVVWVSLPLKPPDSEGFQEVFFCHKIVREKYWAGQMVDASIYLKILKTTME